jgi:hypothetical protein
MSSTQNRRFALRGCIFRGGRKRRSRETSGLPHLRYRRLFELRYGAIFPLLRSIRGAAGFRSRVDTRIVLAEHKSRRYVSGTVHHAVLFLLPTVVAGHNNLVAPLPHTGFRVMKMRILAENVLNDVTSFAGYLVRFVVPTQLVECVLHEIAAD